MFEENTTSVLGVRVDALDKSQVLELSKGFLESPGNQHVATVNAEFIMQAQRDGRFLEILNACHLNVADGVGPQWAAKFLSLPKHKNFLKKFIKLSLTGASLIFWPAYCRDIIPERISGVDLMVDLCGLAAHRGDNVFLLGNYAGSADKAAARLAEMFPGLEAKSLVGPWLEKDGSYNQDENIQVLEEINEYQPQLLFVAFNHPKAQYWIDDNLKKMPSVRIAMGVGGAFDFISGEARRAPLFMRRLGLEWLWRLALQPWRWPRIMTATVRFIYAVYKQE